jgi:hypothetical protein
MVEVRIEKLGQFLERFELEKISMRTFRSF